VLSANKHLSGITNYANRLSIISTDLFQVSVAVYALDDDVMLSCITAVY